MTAKRIVWVNDDKDLVTNPTTTTTTTTTTTDSTDTTSQETTDMTTADDNTTALPLWTMDGDGNWNIIMANLPGDIRKLLQGGVECTTFNADDTVHSETRYDMSEFLEYLAQALSKQAHHWNLHRIQFKAIGPLLFDDVELFSVTREAVKGKEEPNYRVKVKAAIAILANTFKTETKPPSRLQKIRASRAAKKANKKKESTMSTDIENTGILGKAKAFAISIWNAVRKAAEWFAKHVKWAFGMSIMRVEAVFGALAAMYGGLFFYLITGGTIYFTWWWTPAITAIVFLAKFALIALLASFVVTLVCRVSYVAACAVAELVTKTSETATV